MAIPALNPDTPIYQPLDAATTLIRLPDYIGEPKSEFDDWRPSYKSVNKEEFPGWVTVADAQARIKDLSSQLDALVTRKGKPHGGFPKHVNVQPLKAEIQRLNKATRTAYETRLQDMEQAPEPIKRDYGKIPPAEAPTKPTPTPTEGKGKDGEPTEEDWKRYDELMKSREWDEEKEKWVAKPKTSHFADLYEKQQQERAAQEAMPDYFEPSRERSLARQVFAKELSGDMPGALSGAEEGGLLGRESTAKARKLGLSDDQVSGFLKKELAKSIKGDLSADADFYKKGDNLGRFQQIKGMGTSLGVGGDKLEKFIGGIESQHAKDASGKGFPSKEKYEAQKAELAQRHSARMDDSVNIMTGKRGQSGLDYLKRNTNLGEDTIMGQQRKVLEANAQARKLEREKKKKAREAARGIAKPISAPGAIPASKAPSALDYLR